MPLVNDIHSQLNATLVTDVRRPDSLDVLRRTVAESVKAGEPIAICGARHAMGAQQFLSGGRLVDLTALKCVISIDHDVASDGQTYWSDTHQLGVYINDYHSEIDCLLHLALERGGSFSSPITGMLRGTSCSLHTHDCQRFCKRRTPTIRGTSFPVTGIAGCSVHRTASRVNLANS